MLTHSPVSEWLRFIVKTFLNQRIQVFDIMNGQEEALKDADFIYVKNWSAYEDYGKVLSTDSNWMLTNKKLAHTNRAKVMHCLPVRRNVELSDEILDGPNSIVTQQAGNRVWAAQAVLSTLLNG